MENSNLADFLNNFLQFIDNSKGIVITSHANADVDAISSSFLMQSICMELNKKCCVHFESISKEAKIVLDKLGIGSLQCKDLNVNQIVILDTANVSQMGEIGKTLIRKEIKKLLIDHHKEGELSKIVNLYYVDNEASSTTEILVELMEMLSIRPDKDIATLAIMGILADSGNLERAKLSTFRSLVYLIDHGGNYKKAKKILREAFGFVNEEFPARMARLKALSRTMLGKVCGNLIIALSEVGAYESDASRIIIDIGGDIAITLNEKRKGIGRGSIKISERAVERGVDASRIAKRLSTFFNGSGGGHRGAGIFTFSRGVDKEKIFNYAIHIINNEECKSGRERNE
ncbi:MAG: DHH family phosphoesterase [Caldisphaeraceae archaeon]|nr:DHH family phosphoesterase [Caldisphaeraceae archaeon]